jgi:hypothetical protein
VIVKCQLYDTGGEVAIKELIVSSPCIRYDRLSVHRPYRLLFIVLLQIACF